MTDNNNGPVTPTKADFFNGKQIYLWLFNGPSIAAATQMGIFTSTDAIVPWTFKTNAGGVGDSSSLSTVGTGGTPGAPTMVAAGTVGVGSTSSTTLQLVASTVPEPSVLALGGVAGLGMLASRKRRQRK